MLAAGALGQPDVLVAHLLSRGADASARTPEGQSARDRAIAHMTSLAAELEGLQQASDDLPRSAIAIAESRLALRRAHAAADTLSRTLGLERPLPALVPPTLPEPLWLGYRLQKRKPIAMYRVFYGDSLAQFDESCAFGHTGWISDANAAGCHPSEAAAKEHSFDEEEVANAELYAYRAIPLLFGDSGVPQPLEPAQLLGAGASLPAAPDLEQYLRLGYDVTECSSEMNGDWLGCSPLSPGCNGMALGLGSLVNRACLIDDVGLAYDVATCFGIEKPEPGPYVIVEIWRHVAGDTEHAT